MPEESKAANISLKCIKCNTPLMKPSDQIKEFIGLVCGNDTCVRFGLLTVVGKSEKSEEPKSNIIVPGEQKIITPEIIK